MNNNLIASIKDVEEAQYAMNTILIDARSKERYEGINDPVDPIAGHVPGAISHPLGTNLDRTGSFKTKEELKHNFDKIHSEFLSDYKAILEKNNTKENEFFQTKKGYP